jgi:hypothetical protein
VKAIVVMIETVDPEAESEAATWVAHVITVALAINGMNMGHPPTIVPWPPTDEQVASFREFARKLPPPTRPT